VSSLCRLFIHMVVPLVALCASALVLLAAIGTQGQIDSTLGTVLGGAGAALKLGCVVDLEASTKPFWMLCMHGCSMHAPVRLGHWS
jgi:hypothetical protein